MSKHFNDSNFKEEVITASSTKPVLVDFYAEWCGPCKIQGPIIDELAKTIGDKAVVGKVDTEEGIKIAQEYNIMSIPTIMVFRNGKPVETFVGVQSADFLSRAIDKHI